MGAIPVLIDRFESRVEDLLVRVCESLQITPTMHSDAEQRYHAIGEWLAGETSPLQSLRPRVYSQGSMRIGTSVRPLSRQEYDLDLVCHFDGVDSARVPNAVMLLDAIEKRLRDHDGYKDKLERKNRCIRVIYANKFHLDVLPACPDRQKLNGCVVVPDRKLEDWKPSNPAGYAKWFLNQCEIRIRKFMEARAMDAEPLPPLESSIEKAPLKHVVQLVKRARDIYFRAQPELAPISIVLTTLAAEAYGGELTVHSAFGPTIAGVVESIRRSGAVRLVVRNPMNPDEDFSEKWDNPAAYAAFVEFVGFLQRTWSNISEQNDSVELSRLLQELFGEELVKNTFAEQAKHIRSLRESGSLGLKKGAATVASLGPGVLQIPRHTFYGDER